MASRTSVPKRLWRTALVATLLAAAVAGPAAYTFHEYWQSTGGETTYVKAEEVGVAYLDPLTRFLSLLCDARSTAVVGNTSRLPSLTALQTAESAVTVADNAYGTTLGTHRAWTEIQQRVAGLDQDKATGQQAYADYTQTVGLVQALIAKVGDTSQLILDPQLDSYYLMDTLLLRVPALVVDSGTAQDLDYLRVQSVQSPGNHGDQSSVEFFSALDRIAATAANAETGLRKAFDTTKSPSVSPALLGPVDQLRSAVSAMAPGTSLLDLPTVLPTVTAIATQRHGVSDAALRLDTVGLVELRGLLATRQSDLDQSRKHVLEASAVGLLLVGVALWTALPRSKRVEDDDGDDDAQDNAPRTLEEEVDDLMDARALLSSGELVRVGRAVAAKHARTGDHGRVPR
jgi:hypothetical protein